MNSLNNKARPQNYGQHNSQVDWDLIREGIGIINTYVDPYDRYPGIYKEHSEFVIGKIYKYQ